jgi:hypothetical protein
MNPAGYPNARLRLRRVAKAPSAPTSDSQMVLWLDGSRFHLRDETGRSYPEILGDLTAARGFGLTARTIEDFMDAWGAAGRTRKPTDIYADLASDEGIVVEEGGQPWTIDAARLVGLADQVFTDGREQSLEPVAETTYLGRSCTEYRFSIEGEEDGVPYRSDVSWLVSAPYLLRREVRDAPGGRLSAITEVVELVEGVVAEDDLRP